MDQISQLIQDALTLTGQEFPQESIKHVLMSVVFEHHLISVDLTVDQPKKSQFCEAQPEGCIIIWLQTGQILKKNKKINFSFIKNKSSFSYLQLGEQIIRQDSLGEKKQPLSFCGKQLD